MRRYVLVVRMMKIEKDLLKEFAKEIAIRIAKFWSAYDETVQSFVFAYIEELKSHEKLVIWLQTEQGWDWAYDYEEQNDNYPPVLVEDVAQYITQEYIYSKAGSWSNNRIRNYLDTIRIKD